MQPPAFRAQVLKDDETASTRLLVTRPHKASPVASPVGTDDLPPEFHPPASQLPGAEWVELQDLGPGPRLTADDAAAQKSQYVVEAWNDTGLRGVRVTQKELSVIGTNKVVTKIEVVEREPADSPDVCGEEFVDTVVFSVKHTHNVNWRKQLSIHKNLLLACILAGVDCPIEVPEDSIKVFKSIENPQHVHIYLERVIPHFRFRTLPPQVSAFWWRAVGHGTLVFQNWATGKVVALPCKQKGVPAAAETLQRALTLLTHMPPHFFALDPEYAQINVAADEEAAANENQALDSLEKVAEAVQSWALEDGVSPWMTKLIVKCRGARKGQILQYRYSIGVDVAPAAAGSRPYLSQQGTLSGGEANENWDSNSVDTHIYVAIQVHCNEPLSRELKAFPVCMLPIAVEDFSFREVTALYLRCLWFLRKLFEFHQGAAETASQGSGRRPAASPSDQPGFLRNIRANDDKDLQTRNKLAGGARLSRPRFGRTA
eukprot:Gregarina_sp_Pseudo_9__5516@NODE_71_length_4599_cov_21_528728_g65_i0_p2_GENE_NODE_71_length_4599_cov_21_528728_g65_i0NODE_71_length_4599_cov_21_528728_g65_i0_p2_ORF_typecomplete_len486_score139_30EKLF_TAD1/PF16832_5/0_25EKLF_TAD1/PF16832_5/3_8e03_NODE_71_length_4599_cov_21_528728_g65_i012362693